MSVCGVGVYAYVCSCILMCSICLAVFLLVCYSLSALSDVLTALAERRNHVPYRNSTLTHLLKESIGMLVL